MTGPYYTGRAYQTAEERELELEPLTRRDREIQELKKQLEHLRREVKREYFNKLLTQDFWDAVVTEEAPEGVEYAKSVLARISDALNRPH